LSQEMQIISMTLVAGLILVISFTTPVQTLLIRKQLINLPCDLLKYEHFFKKLGSFIWSFPFLAIASFVFFKLNPIFNCIYAFGIVMGLWLVSYSFLCNLHTLCPKCGKLVGEIKSRYSATWADFVLTKKNCPECNFKFEKSPDLVKNIKLIKKGMGLENYLAMAVIPFVLAIIGNIAYLFMITGRMNLSLNILKSPYVWIVTGILFSARLYFIKNKK